MIEIELQNICVVGGIVFIVLFGLLAECTAYIRSRKEGGGG
jgi:hypothetical protein